MDYRIGRYRIAAALTVLGLAGAASLGQEAPSPDAAVDLNEGVYLYLQGLAQEEDPSYFHEAIERFTSALDRDPHSRAALLFRALSHGEIGLLHRDGRLRAKLMVTNLDTTLEIRGDPEQRTRLEQERDSHEQTLPDPSLSAADRVLVHWREHQLDGVLGQVDAWEGKSEEELKEFVRQYLGIRCDAGSRERDAYVRMLADIDRLVGMLDRPEMVIRLLEVVARTKVARLNEDEAQYILRGEIASGEASAPVSELRDEAAAILARSAHILEEVLRKRKPTGINAVRTKFFLGVIRFRQGVPQRTEDEVSQPDMGLLRQSEKIMQELADDPGIDDTWRSYAALYLGLVIPFRAAAEPDSDKRALIYDKAEAALRQSAELDSRSPIDPATNKPDPMRAFSATEGVIPTVIWRQREQIKDLRQRPPVAPELRNDIQLSLYAGAHRDTNVVLLGERTDLPRDISREADFGFASGLVLGYTLDLNKRWTLGFEGRISSLWHGDVDEFDEQNYGGSAAIQYEAVSKKGDFGPVHLRLQYDYNYTLLGRSAFLESHALTPNMRLFWADRRAQTDVYFAYEIRDYREPLYDRRFNRDGEYLTLGLLQSYKVLDMTPRYESMGLEPWGHAGDHAMMQDDPDYPARYLTPYLGLRYAWDATKGDEFDQKSYVLTAGVIMPLPWGIEFDAAADFEWQEYQHGSLIDFHRRPRRDFIQRYAIGLSRTFVLRGGRLENRYTPAFDRVLMILRAHATWTHDDSNVVDRLGQAIFEYDRVLYGLSVAFTFN